MTLKPKHKTGVDRTCLCRIQIIASGTYNIKVLHYTRRFVFVNNIINNSSGEIVEHNQVTNFGFVVLIALFKNILAITK